MNKIRALTCHWQNNSLSKSITKSKNQETDTDWNNEKSAINYPNSTNIEDIYYVIHTDEHVWCTKIVVYDIIGFFRKETTDWWERMAKKNMQY